MRQIPVHGVWSGGVTACEDKTLLECSIETAVLRRSEPDEVTSAVVDCDAVEVMTLEVRVVMEPMPSGGDEEVNEVGVVVYARTNLHLLVGLFAAIIDTPRRGF